MHVEVTTPLATLVDRAPEASRVLLRHGLDFCCGGQRSLQDACARAGLDVVRVRSELESLVEDAPDDRWYTAPIPSLIEHVLRVYHAPLEEDLQQLEAMADKVLRVHQDKDPERLPQLARTVHDLAADLRPHVQKEEQVLFPWILEPRHLRPDGPIGVMRSEHEAAGEMLERIKLLTDDFSPPQAACATWRNLFARLERFDRELREHIHLENNVLFPRVLAD